MGIKKTPSNAKPRVKIGKLDSTATLWLAEEYVKKSGFGGQKWELTAAS